MLLRGRINFMARVVNLVTVEPLRFAHGKNFKKPLSACFQAFSGFFAA